MNKQSSNEPTQVFISDEVLLMCHNLALLTEKEEVAALLIGQVSVYDFFVKCCVITVNRFFSKPTSIVENNVRKWDDRRFRIGAVDTASRRNKKRSS
jgi:hypothetical protein